MNTPSNNSKQVKVYIQSYNIAYIVFWNTEGEFDALSKCEQISQ